jgi:hypothetical protein
MRLRLLSAGLCSILAILLASVVVIVVAVMTGPGGFGAQRLHTSERRNWAPPPAFAHKTKTGALAPIAPLAMLRWLRQALAKADMRPAEPARIGAEASQQGLAIFLRTEGNAKTPKE